VSTDEFARFIKDNHAGLWCKGAGLLLALLNFVPALLTASASVPGAVPEPWIFLLVRLLQSVVTSLWYFFVLYALGSIIEVLAVRTDQRRPDSAGRGRATAPGPRQP